MNYQRVRALVTGGLGFIGSNLSIRLVELGARVTILDSSIPGCGANLFNIEPVKDSVTVIPFDIGEPEKCRAAIAESDVIFNMAGEISHIHSMQFPERDLQLNTVAHLRFLLECISANPLVRIVYASTRQVFGIPKYLPVDEGHPIRPVDFNGVHKYAATMYHLMLSRTGHLDAKIIRLTNIYGPRMALALSCQGFLSTFFRRVVLGQPLEVFGDGRQLRDPLYVDDAVDAILKLGADRESRYRDFNVGGPAAHSLAEIAQIMSQQAGLAAPQLKAFPEARKAIDIGSYRSDWRRIEREMGWKPVTAFSAGVSRTLEYYRAHLDQYLDVSQPMPTCAMPEHTGVPHRLTYSAV